MGAETLRAKLRRIEALRSMPDMNALAHALRRSLMDGSNHVVAKAAAIAASRYLPDLIPDLVAAYERFFVNPSAADPLALGKTAVAQALKELDFRDPAPFIRGLQYFQPVGRSDPAAELRATCAHALVACDLDGLVRFELLIDHLIDPDRTVRREVVRAITQIGGPESVLILRLKALMGDSDAEVLGECFAALLDIEPREAVAFVGRFLTQTNADIIHESATALAASRAPEALKLVRQLWEADISTELRRAIIFSSAASPRLEAGEFLLSIVANRRGEPAQWALSALASSRFRRELKERARAAAHTTADLDIVAAYARAFESIES